jgi:hypothetical protein
MSEVEKFRALTLVTVLAAALLALFAFQSRGANALHSGVRDPLELCAASKGTLCDETADSTVAGAAATADIADLGHIVVTAPRGGDEGSDLQVAYLGSITVTAPRA